MVDGDDFTLRGAKKTRAFTQADNLPRGVVEGYYPDFELYPERDGPYDRAINERLPVPYAPVNDVAPADVDYRRNYMPERVMRVPGTETHFKIKADGTAQEVPTTSSSAPGPATSIP